jgi:bifunctional non-homologous end joining protein LigD
LLPKPMLAKKLQRIPEGPGWWMEPKYDGWRVLAGFLNGVVMWTRTGNHVTQVPYIREAIAASFPAGTILDGEVVDLRSGSKRQWNRTQSILEKTKGGYEHTPTANDPPLTYVIFDVLCIGGTDVRNRPLAERRALLEKHCAGIEQSSDAQLLLTPTQPPSDAGLKALVEYGFEGVVVKRIDSLYVCGSRKGAWGKIKPYAEIEALCTGVYEAKRGSHYAPVIDGRVRPWAVGGICFRVTHDDGRVYNGRAAGMNDALRRQLYEEPEQFIGLVVDLAHWGVGETGALRHPNVKRFRSKHDKSRKEWDETASRR